MKIVIIYSNHQQGNFNEQLLERIKQTLLFESHEFVVRDLYAMNFNPVLKTRDFEQIITGQTPEDIMVEQNFIRWADLLLFVYPVWWGGMPAIVKGYIDRVFSSGFAYKATSGGVEALLKGKKALVLSSMGQARADYEKGMFKAMNTVNVEGIFGFCGIEVADEIYFSSIHNISPVEKEQYFQQGSNAIRSVVGAFVR